MKFWRMAGAILLAIGLYSIRAFSGQWMQSGGAWWYDYGDGTYPANVWVWIDDDGDGIAECYCFNKDGWLYMAGITPDGYYVNADGCWEEFGVVQLKSIPRKGPFLQYLSYEDYVVTSRLRDKGQYYEADAVVYNTSTLRWTAGGYDKNSSHYSGLVRFAKDAECAYMDAYGFVDGIRGLKYMPVSLADTYGMGWVYPIYNVQVNPDNGYIIRCASTNDTP